MEKGVKNSKIFGDIIYGSSLISERVPQRTHRARNCDVTVRVSRQLTVLVPVRQQAKCEAKHWFSHWLHSKWKVLKKHIKREIAVLKHFFSPYNIEISDLYSYHFFKYWNFDILWFSLFLCPNGKLGCCWNVRQVAVFTSTAIQSRIPPLGVCSVDQPNASQKKHSKHTTLPS